MQKIIKIVLEAIVFLFSLFILFGAIIEPNVLAKVMYILAAIIICPFIYFIFKKKASKKRYLIIRGGGVLACFILLMISTVFFADRSINEKMVVDKGVIYIQDKYSDYDTIDVKKYNISVVEEKKEEKTVKLELVINALKDGYSEIKTETCFVAYNEETREYNLLESREGVIFW